MRQRKTKRHDNVKKCHDWFVGPERYSKFALKSKSSEMLFSAIFMEYIFEKKPFRCTVDCFQATDLRFCVLATKTNPATNNKTFKNKGKI